MRFETTNGSIQAEFPDGFSAAISARTTNGSINCDFPMTMQGRFSRTALEGRIGNDGGRLTLRTTNGSIAIRRR
jgi:lia operon protein LiaG